VTFAHALAISILEASVFVEHAEDLVTDKVLAVVGCAGFREPHWDLACGVVKVGDKHFVLLRMRKEGWRG